MLKNLDNKYSKKQKGIKNMNNAKTIMKTLKANGHDSFIVGGCVRDEVLGKTPHDIDIATTARPEDINRIFNHGENYFAIPQASANEHGVAFVMFNNEKYEVATLRADKDCDGRHAIVEFGVSINEDLARRDFTVNAMAKDFEGNIIDPFNGRDDIKNKIIRAVGSPEKRFAEDSLRMLRAVRFASKLGFTIEANTFETICKHSSEVVKNVSGDRQREELTKLLSATQANSDEGIKLAIESGLFAAVLPELMPMVNCAQNNPHHEADVMGHTIKAIRVSNTEDTNILWAMLLHDAGKPATKETGDDGIDHFNGHAKRSHEIAESIMERMHFSNIDKKEILFLVKNHDVVFENLSTARRWLAKFGEALLRKLLIVRTADIMAQSTFDRESKLASLRKSEALLNEAIATSSALSVKDLAISGKDLIRAGVTPGPAMGAILNKLLEQVMDNPELNTKEQLMALV